MKTTLNLILAFVIALAGVATAADDDKSKKKAKNGIFAADKDGDGKVTLDEFKAWGAARPKPLDAEKAAKQFKRRDKDGDGAITKADVAKRPKKDGDKKKPKKDGDKKKPKKDGDKKPKKDGDKKPKKGDKKDAVEG